VDYSGLAGKLPGNGSVAGRTSRAGLVGGTVSVIGGGKFANGACTAALQHLLNYEHIYPEDKRDAKVDLAFYDKEDKGDVMDRLASHEDFKAAAENRSAKAIGVSSEKDIIKYFKETPGLVNSMGFFGHGNKDGISINGNEVTASTIKLMIRQLSPSGTLYIFSCNVADHQYMNKFTKHLNNSQAIWAHKGGINYGMQYTNNGIVHTGRIRSDGEDQTLWMYKYTKK
jgi:hypothetical protein